MTDKMRFRTGDILTTVGAAIGVLGGIAMAVRLKLTITPELREVLFYKELFVASAVLLVLGAIIGRRQRAEKQAWEAREQELLSGGPPPIGDEQFKVRPHRDEIPEER